MHRGKGLFKIATLIFIIGFLFEYFLIPFERTAEEHLYPYSIISLFHVGTATLTYLLYFTIVGPWVKEDMWRVYKEGLALFILLLFIGINEWLIRDLIYNNPRNWELAVLIEEVWHAYLSGTVVIVLVLFTNLRTLEKRHTQQAETLPIDKSNENEPSIYLFLKTQSASDDFTLDLSKLLCAHADGNYVEFYLKTDDSVERLIKRLTFQSALEQFQDYPFLVKTHRAWLVNSHQVARAKGNAQGYQLTLNRLDFEVPVSRAHLADFTSRMQSA